MSHDGDALRPRGDHSCAPDGGRSVAAGAPDYVVVGHVSRDVVPGGYRLGGTVTYSGLAAAKLGCRVGILTSAGRDLDALTALRDAAARVIDDASAVGPVGSGARIEVAVVSSEASTIFENVYEGLNATSGGHRRQFVRARAAEISAADAPVAWRRATVVHLGPIAQEVGPELFAAFPEARVRGVTPQGWLRRWDASGRVEWTDLADPAAQLGAADVVVLSEEDVAGNSNTLDRYAAIARRLVVTHGAGGATLYAAGRQTIFPACPTREVDPTGAGDVFATALFIRLAETGDAAAAVRFANAAASFAVEGVGTTTLPTRDGAESRLDTAETIISASERSGGWA